ncbi:MAG: DUF3822 family protein [Prevotella sp.]|jgi:hypothetical protein|nr:DUF3822 family protein [Prevotella sp.]
MFLPENIDLGHSEKYVLSIRIKPNGFMFSIYEPDNGKSYCLRETTFSDEDDQLNNIQRIVFELNFLTQEFKQTNVVVVSKDYELVPAIYFDKKNKEELYDFSHMNKSGHVVTGLIENQDVITLFDLETETFEFLTRNLWNPRFFHHSNLIINHFEKRDKFNTNRSKMYINLHDSMMDIVCFSGRELVHCLTYENEPTANQIYFILKLWEKFAFNQQEDYLYIAGKVIDDLLIEKLQLYIRNIERLNTPSEIHFWTEDAHKAPLDLLYLSL